MTKKMTAILRVMNIKPYLKAVVGGLGAVFAAGGAAALDGNFELYEWFTTIGAFFPVFSAIYFTPNLP